MKRIATRINAFQRLLNAFSVPSGAFQRLSIASAGRIGGFQRLSIALAGRIGGFQKLSNAFVARSGAFQRLSNASREQIDAFLRLLNAFVARIGAFLSGQQRSCRRKMAPLPGDPSILSGLRRFSPGGYPRFREESRPDPVAPEVAAEESPPDPVSLRAESKTHCLTRCRRGLRWNFREEERWP
jgi:hypothetical protein